MTLYEMASRYIGLKEVPGVASNETILAMLKLDNNWPQDDDVPWCSAFVNYIAWHLRMPRSKSLRARSWLRVGMPIPLESAQPHNDIVILKRGKGVQPGPEEINAPGHVGIFAGFDDKFVYLVGGNQSDEVNLAPYKKDDVLGIRRLG